MRLTELRRRIDIAADKFQLKSREQNGTYYIDDIQSLKIAVNELIRLGFLEKKVFGRRFYFQIMPRYRKEVLKLIL